MSENFKCLMKKTFKWSLLIFVGQLLMALVMICVLASLGMERLPEPINTIMNIILMVDIIALVVSPFLGWWDEIKKELKEFLKTDC